jgi:hypothetical protein
VSCDNPPEEPFCQFHVSGRVEAVSSFSEYRLYVFVFPVTPPGAGWYLQKLPAPLESNGNWQQNRSYLGNVQFPAKQGDTFQIRAVLVRDDATVDGKKLEDMAKSNALIVLASVEDIQDFVAVSDIVDVTLNR